MEASGLRHEIEELVAAGHWQRAAGLVRVLWEQEGGAALAGFVVSTFGRIAGNLDLTPHRCAILRSFTVEPIVPVLKACALTSGVDLAVHAGDFNAYPQELLDGESSLYGFQPDTVILARWGIYLTQVGPIYCGQPFQSSRSTSRSTCTAWVPQPRLVRRGGGRAFLGYASSVD
jgi:hypothetical protein